MMWADVLRPLRNRFALAFAVATTVVPVLTFGVAGTNGYAVSTSVLGVFVATRFALGLRGVVSSRELRRVLLAGKPELVVAHSIAPVLGVLLWIGAVGPLASVVVSCVLIPFSSVAGVVVLLRRPKPSFAGPVIDTGFGAFPVSVVRYVGTFVTVLVLVSTLHVVGLHVAGLFG